MLLSKDEVFFNARKRYYLKDNQPVWLDTLICDKPVFNPSAAEHYSKSYALHPYHSGHMEGNVFVRDFNDWEVSAAAAAAVTNAEENAERSARRAKNKVFELALCNSDELNIFCTLTVSPDTGIRYEYNELIKKLKDWLSNRVRRNGLKYVIVPELHKNGAIHFHGLINNALELTDSGTVLCPQHNKPIKVSTADRYHIADSDRQLVYNLLDWKYGFSTAMFVTDRKNGSAAAAAAYIAKYINKDMQHNKIGGRYYLSGGQLQRPQAVYFNAAFEDCTADENTKETEFEICGKKWLKQKPKCF